MKHLLRNKEFIDSHARTATSEALAVLKALQDGKLSLAEASERTNAIGKANGAISQLIKSDGLELILDRQSGRDLEA